MEKDREHIDILIAKYVSGEALPEDAIQLDEWKQESSENRLYFDECMRALSIPQGKPVNIDRMYSQIVEETGLEKLRTVKVYSLRQYLSPLRIAASFLILSLCGLLIGYLMRSESGQPPVLIASSDSTRKQQLADGSQVFLNKHTKLFVEEGFNKKERRIRIEGEAFFEVVHNDEKPFVIDAGGVLIRDIGTSFNINAKPESDSVVVYVTEGIVDISNDAGTIRLTKNQSAVYIRSLNRMYELTSPEATANIGSYKTKDFHFRSATLAQVVGELNAVYDQAIVIENPVIASCRITVDFNNEPLETVVGIIAETLDLTYIETEQGFLLMGNTCIQ